MAGDFDLEEYQRRLAGHVEKSVRRRGGGVAFEPRTSKPAKRRRGREAKILPAIIDAINGLQKTGVRCKAWRNTRGKRRIEGRWQSWGLAEGAADIIGMVEGRFFSGEVKPPGEDMNDKQTWWAEKVREGGGFACLLRSTFDAIAAVERASLRNADGSWRFYE